MKPDPILEELWRVKDALSREMAADPAAYGAKFDDLANGEEKAGRKVIRSAGELRCMPPGQNNAAGPQTHWF